MQTNQSASGMIFRQLNQQNIRESRHAKTHHQKIQNSVRKNSQFSLKGKSGKENNQNSPIKGLSQNEATGQNFFPAKRQSTLKVKYLNSHEITGQNEHNDLTLIKVSPSTESKNISGTQNIKCPLGRQSYIKRLVQTLPANNYNLSTIRRQFHMFSQNDISLFVKDQQMLHYVKKSTFFHNQYEIICSNHRLNLLGTVKSNFSGSRFDIYERMDQSHQYKLIATIYYDSAFTLSKKIRNIEMYVVKGEHKQNMQHHETYCEDSLKNLYNQQDPRIIKLVNKQPTLNAHQEYILDFGVEYILPSTKNTILVEEKTEKEALKLYKINDNEFQLKVCERMSVFVGYCFALSATVFKWACQ